MKTPSTIKHTMPHNNRRFDSGKRYAPTDPV
jgi:hypothetical protein